MTFHTLNQSAAFLPKAFDDLRFGFYGKTLQGTPQQRDRWKRAISNVNADLGDAVGKIYVAKYFPPSSKTELQGMVKNLLAAFDKRVDGLEWMAPATKAQAKAKIKTIRVGVGYPETWRDYKGLVIRPDDPVGNAWRASEWEYRHQTGQVWEADRPRRMVDDSADGQRGQPAAPERAQLPGRDPRSRPTSIRKPMRPRTTARSARPSATRSATASTIPAPNSTPRASSRIGGRRKTRPISRKRASGSSINTAPMRCCRA